jgi:hypothetical protein
MKRRKKTILHLDDEALRQAMESSKGETETDVINEALREYARHHGRPRPATAAPPPVGPGREGSAATKKRTKAREPAEGGAPVYDLRIELQEIKPAIWRRVRVRGDINLGLLHAVIQVAMGWTNSHLHQFKIGKRFFVDPECEENDIGGPPRLTEHPVALTSVVPKAGGQFVYEYDFGDSWEHAVTVERAVSPAPKMSHFAECLDGRRACPPEDCGGAHAYPEFLEAIGDPEHEEHESMLEWVAGAFDPEAFDLAKVNAALRKLRWPRTTIGQLGRVLLS